MIDIKLGYNLKSSLSNSIPSNISECVSNEQKSEERESKNVNEPLIEGFIFVFPPNINGRPFLFLLFS